MSVKSAVRVLRIFELLSVHKEGLSNKQICTYLKLPQSSASGLIKTLLDENYLSLNKSNQFILGPKLIPVGQAAMESFNLSNLGVEDLKALMLKVEETVFMATLVDNELIYIAKIDSNRSIRTSAFLGGKKPLYCTGLGKAYLAFMPYEERETYLQQIKLEPITDHTITDKEELKTKLLDYQHQGYAIDDEENEEGLYCLAAPIFNSTGEMEAAISIAGPKARMLKHEANIVQYVKNTASMISNKLGYRGG